MTANSSSGQERQGSALKTVRFEVTFFICSQSAMSRLTEAKSTRASLS